MCPPTASVMTATRPSRTAAAHHPVLAYGLVMVSLLGVACSANRQAHHTAGTGPNSIVTGMIATDPTASPAAPVATSTGPLPVGAINPDVTQSTIGHTICVRGWTATVRPPETYTSALKARQLAVLGYADRNPADYELDHIIPLELGGAPRDEANLRPEAWPAAHTKDKEEDRLHAAVCGATMTLDEARVKMAAYAANEQGLAAGPAAATTTQTTGAAPTSATAYYPNCAAVRAAGKAPLHRGDPGYRPGLDGDGDGIACE